MRNEKPTYTGTASDGRVKTFTTVAPTSHFVFGKKGDSETWQTTGSDKGAERMANQLRALGYVAEIVPAIKG